MANTTNFGWETPDDTDLVKDGAAAMRTLGNAIDASLVDLKGGTTGQVLSKNTNTDMDFTWVTTNDADAIQNSIVDAKGDLISATADNTPARLASSGVNGQVLTIDTSTSTGLKWAAPAGGGKVLQVVSATLTASTSTNSTTFVDTGLSATITPSAATSKILIYLNAPGAAAYAGTNQTDIRGLFRLVRTSTTINAGTIGIYNQASASSQNHTPPYFAYLDSPNTTSATTYKITYRAISANVDFYFQGLVTDSIASLILMEIGA